MIIFSKTEEEHIEHAEGVLKKLLEAKMRVSVEKSQFFKESVEYLCFTVSDGDIRSSPGKN